MAAIEKIREREAPDERVDFVYVLEGAVDGVDIFTLAPTLLHLGQLINDSNNALNPAIQKVGVNVRPFRPGSFVVDIDVFRSAGDFAQGLLMTAGLVGVPEILKALGLIADTGTSLIDLLKALRGKTPTVEQVKPNEYRITADNGSTALTINGNVHQLFMSPAIADNMKKIYETPMQSPGVSGVRTFLKGQESETQVLVTRQEAAEIQVPPVVEAPPTDHAVSESTVFLNPSKVSVEGEGGQWWFRRGGLKLTATIRDPDFLRLCKDGDVRMHHTDLLQVVLRETQTVRNTKVVSVYEIVKVLKYRRADEQMELPIRHDG